MRPNSPRLLAASATCLWKTVTRGATRRPKWPLTFVEKSWKSPQKTRPGGHQLVTGGYLSSWPGLPGAALGIVVKCADRVTMVSRACTVCRGPHSVDVLPHGTK